MEKIFLGLGSNLGDRFANLTNAVQSLPPAVKVVEVSPVYQTEPWGYTEQPAFLNQVILAKTGLAPEKLLSYLKSIEISVGRKPTFHYGPRQIDIDILFYGQQIISKDTLTIPHPHLHQRAFVLVPLADLAPDFRHPVLGLTITELLSQVETAGVSVYT